MKIFLVVCMMLVFGKLSESRPRYDTFADLYSSMGDINWGKRSGYDNWISPAYGYSSMADSEWGWKKRSLEPVDDEGEADYSDIEKRSSSRINNYNTPYRYRQPYNLAASSYMPHKSFDEPQSSINAAADSQIKNKRNLASLARDNGLPTRFRSRRVDDSVDKGDISKLIYQDPLAFLAQNYNLVNDGDFHRPSRSGISSLARTGSLRHNSRR